MELLNLMKSRYSVRSYDSKQISKEDLETILEAGRVAPTAANRQTQRILVVDSEEGIQKIGKSTRTNGSPLIMLVCSKQDESWVNWFDPKILHNEFKIPAEYKIINILQFGYSNGKVLSSDRHQKTRKPLNETVFYNNFSV